jgi:hypothetical protein
VNQEKADNSTQFEPIPETQSKQPKASGQPIPAAQSAKYATNTPRIDTFIPPFALVVPKEAFYRPFVEN